MSDVIVIGVAGGTGSGKTTLVKALVNRFGDNITVLSHDNYYKRHDELSYEERTKLNYDHPDAFDTDMMIEHLQQLKSGKAIECPTYDYTIHNRAEETITIEPRKVIVVEGILIFASRALCDEMDIRIFVDADADVRLCRRIRREAERGRALAAPAYLGCVVWSLYGGRELIPAEVFGSSVPVRFEGHTYCAPGGYDTYLRRLYGDYAPDPPPDKQVSHHHFRAWYR